MQPDLAPEPLRSAAAPNWRAIYMRLARLLRSCVGRALVIVEDRGYRLSHLDCMHIPAGVAHSVRNAEADSELVMHWAFGSAEPTRVLVDERSGFEDRGDEFHGQEIRNI